jgi:Tfp pilus assembly protein FimT
LIELLVVIIILTTLVSAAIPLLSPTNDDRRLREASRGVNSFIAAAQMKAVQLQRPFGVAIKRLSQDTSNVADNAVSIELFYVEQPTPFRGFDDTSAVQLSLDNGPTGSAGRVLVQFVRRGNDIAQSSDGLPDGWDRDPLPPNTVRLGDVIEVQGSRFRFIDTLGMNPPPLFYDSDSGTPDGRLVTVPINDTGQQIYVKFDDQGYRLGPDRQPSAPNPPPPPFFTYPASYKILRQPMPASAEPFQMPDGTAIDLRASGQAIEIGSSNATGFFYNPDVPAPNQTDCVNNADPIIVMFTPEGAIERVRLNRKNVAIAGANDNIFDGKTVSNIFLLIGRRAIAPPPTVASNTDKTLNASNYTPTPTDEQKQTYKEAVNWLRGESRWIVIGAQSGRVVTVDNAFVDPTQFFPVMEPLDVVRARQIHAAREFAREMVQVGGR